MVRTDYSLRHHNTFGIAAIAARYAEIKSPGDLRAATAERDPAATLVLGGGSNLLLPDYFDGLVLFNNIQSIEPLDRKDNTVLVKVGGGVNWHELVLWSLARGFGGLENLALIPGTVGAAPIQNIGAYGRELQDVFVSLDAYELTTGNTVTFTKDDCEFGYRHSYFKRPDRRGKHFITYVTFRLTTRDHAIHTEYGAIREHLTERGVTDPTPGDVAGAVIEIRRAKLPDWRTLGNAGSFFKNPVIARARFEELLARHPDLPSYPAGEDTVKIPAAWLIDRRGWKGRREGTVGCYEKQALVLVNHGGATSADVLAFSERIMADVEAGFGIRLEREVSLAENVNNHH